MSSELRQDSLSPVHWSKDFVEHLRTVHFALIATSTALILIMQTAKPYDPETVRNAIHEINLLKSQWSPEWLMRRGVKKEEAREGSEVAKPKVPSDDPLADVPDKSKTDFSGIGRLSDWNRDPLVPDSTPPNAALSAPDLSAGNQFPIPPTYSFFGTIKSSQQALHFTLREKWIQENNAFTWSPDQFPDTLTNFEEWWDGMEKRHFRVIFPRTIIMFEAYYHGERGNEFVQMVPDSLPGEQQPVELNLSSLMASLSYHDGPFSLHVGRFVYVEVSPQFLQPQFAQTRIGSFERAFPELKAISDSYGPSRLTDIEATLSSEAAKAGDTFEFQGVKFPISNVTIWGVIVLWLIQLYFFIYLKQLSGKLSNADPGWDVPWIGMNTDVLARMLFFLSVILLPCVAVSLLASHIRFSSQEHLTHLKLIHGSYILMAVTPAACLGILSWVYRPTLKEPLTTAIDSKIEPQGV